MAWYSVTGTSAAKGKAPIPPAIGQDSSEPRWEQCPQWTNMPKRAPSNQLLSPMDRASHRLVSARA